MSEYDSPIFEPDDGLTEAISQVDTDASPEVDTLDHPVRPPGPGFIESVAWTFSALALHIIGGILAGIVLIFVFLSEHNWAADQLQFLLRNQQDFEKYVNSKPTWLIGIEMSTFVLGVILLTLVRLGKDRRKAIPLGPPLAWHLALTMLWVLPLSMVCSQIGVIAGEGWNQLSQLIPALKGLDELNIMESIGDVVSGMPRWQVYLWIAVAPAVGEELLFRVLIGRGLVARYGAVTGIALTTVLFASVHFHPVHMIALIPLSVAIHISYLSSKSVWIPMLAHFLNNAWAVSVMLATAADAAQPSPSETMGDALFPWWLIVSSALVSLCIGIVYWKTRLRLSRISESSEALPQQTFLSADRGPSRPGEFLTWRPPSFQYYAALVAALLFFGISLAIHLRNSLSGVV